MESTVKMVPLKFLVLLKCNSGFFKCSNSTKLMPPMDYTDAVELCESSGSEVGWISPADAKNFAKDIIADDSCGNQLLPPYIFWTGVVRMDALYFRNYTDIINLLDKFPETEFWSTTISDKGLKLFWI